MQRLVAIVLIGVAMLVTGFSGMRVAGDNGPDGNGSLPLTVQMAGDNGPDGNG
ncbi:MAG TPA: hypothetical protein VGK88_06800 [bacterium]|jgi:hypothetical protein